MNGYLKHVLWSRGICQGCPISALLYIFVAEILALQIDKNTDIQGLKFEDMQHKIKKIQHVDDLTVVVKILYLLKMHCQLSKNFVKHVGSKFNIEKTECMLLGSFKNTDLCDEIRDIKINR